MKKTSLQFKPLALAIAALGATFATPSSSVIASASATVSVGPPPPPLPAELPAKVQS